MRHTIDDPSGTKPDTLESADLGVMTMPNIHHAAYLAQTWDRETLVSEVGDLSLDAAREVARAACLTGHTGRLMAQDTIDYCEVYDATGVRRGTWADTTRVVFRPA